MSTRRLNVIVAVPHSVKRLFSEATEPQSNEERLWRERAARMVLDALGNTNLTVKPKRHNEAVRYARRWLKELIADDDAEATFDAGGIIGYPEIRRKVLAIEPALFPDPPEDDYDGEAVSQ
jgi:hypothetical protein